MSTFENTPIEPPAQPGQPAEALPAEAAERPAEPRDDSRSGRPGGRRQRRFTPRLILGIGLVVLGLCITLENLGIQLGHHLVWRLWPLILVALGLSKLHQDRSSTGGTVLMAIGAFFLLVNFGLGEVLAPLMLVAAGIWVVVKALQQHREVPPDMAGSEEYLRGVAIFSGFKPRRGPGLLKGGELTAIFGGFEVDLSQVRIPEEGARLDVFCLFGGGELRIPAHWDVRVQTAAIFGGVDDKTHPYHAPEGAEAGARPRLTLTGTVLFGGLTLKS